MRFLSMSFPIILAVFLAVVSISQMAICPMPPEGVAAEKYTGFSGVLTIAIENTLIDQFPNLQRWVNDITNLFEKSNKGIYLRCITFDATNAQRITQGPQPADIILGGPGYFTGELWIDAGEYTLLPAFRGDSCAVPVAAGGYILGHWGEPPASLDLLPDETIGYCDEFSTLWIALCEQFSPVSTEKRTAASPDIGLASAETPQATESPVQGTTIARRNLYSAAPEALFSDFLQGKIRAMPLDQAQLSKIIEWQEDGRYEEIRFLNAAAFTDRVVYAAIPKSGRIDAAERGAAASKFIEKLLSDEAQARLAKNQMFPTAITDTFYEAKPGMQLIDSALRRSDCIVQQANEPPISADFGALIDGSRPARELMRELRNRR